jgi:hypothetical protein
MIVGRPGPHPSAARAAKFRQSAKHGLQRAEAGQSCLFENGNAVMAERFRVYRPYRRDNFLDQQNLRPSALGFLRLADLGSAIGPDARNANYRVEYFASQFS